LATLGLATCLEIAGAGGALAVLGKVLALAGIQQGAQSEADKAHAVSKLRSDIAALRTMVVNKSQPAPALRDRLVNEFTGLCRDVQRNCLQ